MKPFSLEVFCHEIILIIYLKKKNGALKLYTGCEAAVYRGDV